MLEREELESILASVLPVRGDGFEVQRAEGDAEHEASGALSVPLRLVIADPQGRVPDVREQVVHVATSTDRERLAMFLRAWLASLPAIVAARGTDVSALLPFDLAWPELIDDASLATADDFARELARPERLAEAALARDRDEAEHFLSRWGLEDRWREYLAIPQPGIALAHPEPEPEDERREAIGCTRLGGTPDLPDDFAWPESNGRPMTFAAQIELGDLPSCAAASALPPAGLLTFFYDASPDIPRGGAIRYPCAVDFHAADASLSPRPTPEGGDERPSIMVQATDLGAVPAPIESPFYEALAPIERVMAHRALPASAPDPLEGLGRVLMSWTLDGDERAHRLLGHCKPYQGDPYLEAELHASGIGFAGWVEGSRSAVEASRRARRWRLLLQLNAEHDDGLLFEQDCGFVYFMIPEDALARHDWSQVFVVVQCS